MKKTKQVKRKLSLEKLRIAKLDNASELMIKGGEYHNLTTVGKIGTGSLIPTGGTRVSNKSDECNFLKP